MKRTLVPLLIGMVLGTTIFAYAPPLVTSPAMAQGDCQDFPETRQRVCGIFLRYWRENGGLAQQGYPISGVFKEKSTNGQTYDTQYFERAIFEHHPENAGTRFEVLLRLVGEQAWEANHPSGPPVGSIPVQSGQALTVKASIGDVMFRIRIDAVQEAVELPKTEYMDKAPRAKGKFVVVPVRVENLSKESGHLWGSEVRIRDSQGRLFDMDGTSDAHSAARAMLDRESYTTTVQPSLSIDTVLVFDVAPDASGFSMVANED